MNIKHDLMDISDFVNSALNGIWIGSVIGYVAGAFTSPKLLTFLTILWAIGRTYEMWSGEPFNIALKRWFKFRR